MPKKDDGISDEDRALFRRSVQDVKTVRSSHSRISHKKYQAMPIHLNPYDIDENVSTFPILCSNIINSVGTETMLHFHRSGIPKKQLQALKNGQYAIEAVLDLHGRMPDDAQCVIAQFITMHYALHKRHVLIIHGKGGRHGEAPPVIKNLVNRWLPQFAEVLAFHSALARDGGAGALYVLLKQKR